MKKLVLILGLTTLLGLQLYGMQSAKKRQRPFATGLLLRAFNSPPYSIQDRIDAGNPPTVSERGDLDISRDDKLVSLEGLDRVKNPERVRAITLYGTGVTEIPEGIFDCFINLSELSLCGNFKEIRKGVLASLSNLTMLRLSSPFLTSLPDDLLDSLPNLNTLSIANTRITEFPQSLLAKLSRLEKVFLCSNQVCSLDPYFFSSQRYLETINLSNNRLTQLPRELFARNVCLKEVNLKHNQLVDVPAMMFKKTQLATLSLEGNPLEPATIEELLAKGIRPSHTVSMVYDKQYSVKDLIAKLTEQGRLDQLVRVHDGHGGINLSLCGLTSLEGLNEIPLPEGIQITAIILENNYLKEIPDGVFSRFPALKTLDLKNNFLTEVPRTIFGEQVHGSLGRLCLAGNQLTSLEDGSFSAYPALKSLDVSKNIISKITPGVFSRNRSLGSVNLSDNNLSHIPKGLVSRLKKLICLNIKNNELGEKDIKDLYGQQASVYARPQRPTSLKVHAARILGQRLKGAMSQDEKAKIERELICRGFSYLL